MDDWEAYGPPQSDQDAAPEVDFDEWNEEKAATNEQKHGVSFDEAMTTWLRDPESDSRGYRVAGEERFVRVGWSSGGRKLMVVYCLRADRVRIISARIVPR